MDARALAAWRLHHFGLTEPRFDDPAEVVRWLGAVQSQDYLPAKWSIAQRTAGRTNTEIEAAFNAGRILRTHVLRPTWHFVLPNDIRWLLQVTGPRVHMRNRGAYRTNELDAPTLVRAATVITDHLQGGNNATRRELGDALARHGISAEGSRLAHIVMWAELEALICSGPLRGSQQTYGLLDERAPGARALDDDEALAELTRRYFISHGPASAGDLQAWASLTLTQVRRGLDMVAAEFESIEFDGLTLWFDGNAPPRDVPVPPILLLQLYDEYIMGYRESRGVIDVERTGTAVPPGRPGLNGTVVVGTQAVGEWRRESRKETTVLRVRLPHEPDEVQRAALAREADRYAAFVQTPVELLLG